MPHSTKQQAATDAATPWQTPWPPGDLEHVPECPVCACASRRLLHEDLVDNVFFVAPGRWQLYRCSQCACAYLDPRPDQASIGRAYEIYYTHAAATSADPATGPLPRGKDRLSNGYLNRRYGTNYQPASALGVPLARLLPHRRQKLDAAFRYLPRPRPGQTLLDVGCGNGDFLLNARDAGWNVSGVDPDPKAALAAAQRGLDVRCGSIDDMAGHAGSFDAVTLSHVLEHVHDPVAFLQAVHALLKPGGVVYIDTPNIDSRGAQRWGRNWRGLETPRHLVLFSLAGLKALVQRTGFTSPSIKRRTAVRKFLYLASLRMQAGKSPYGREPATLPNWMKLGLRFAQVPVEHDEFLTLLARKR
jgi:2-polyprenyl-3-methyl-5-hydroxy-6-metoxy-1,4-benzoquinol methylase